MGTELLSQFILDNYEIHEWKHACAILHKDFPGEWKDIVELLENFRLKKSWIVVGGGRKSRVSEFIDSFLYQKGWIEKSFDTQILIDGKSFRSPTHNIDCYKNRIALARIIHKI